MDISPKDFYSKFNKLFSNQHDAIQIMRLAEMKKYKRGDVLITYGETNDTLFMIWEGQLQLFIVAGDAKISIGKLNPGRWVGELGFIDVSNASAEVVALEDTTVFTLDHKALMYLEQSEPQTFINLLQAVSLDLAIRLRNSKDYALKQTNMNDFDLTKRSDTSHISWYKRVGNILMGLKEDY